MKKKSLIFLPFITLGCGTNSNANAKQKNPNFLSHYVNRVGYITTKNEGPTNLIKKSIDSLSTKYGYLLDGSSDLAFKMKQNTTRVYKADKHDRIIDALKLLERNRVGLVFIEGSDKFNTEKIYDAIKVDEIYTGRLFIFGDEVINPKKNDGSIVRDKVWRNDRIATFSFSKIISAYMTGYLTQTNFGLTADGTKKKVSYLLGVSVEPGKSKKRKEDISKAIAFKKGIEDAVKDQKTGEVYFVPETGKVLNGEKQTLIMEYSVVPSIVEDMGKDKQYLAADHSFAYISGASNTINYDVAYRLTLKATKNKQGHKLIVDNGSTDEGYALEYSADVNVIEGEEGENPQKNSTARVGLAFNKDLEFSQTFDYTKQYATQIVIEEIFKKIFKDDTWGDYFANHNLFGTFGIVMPSGKRTISSSMQKARPDLRKKLLETIIGKNIKEKMFEEDNFFGRSQ